MVADVYGLTPAASVCPPGEPHVPQQSSSGVWSRIADWEGKQLLRVLTREFQQL